MAEQNNFYKITGVIYAKPVREGTAKKTNKPYSISSLILEVRREYKGTTYIELPEFELGKGVSLDDFALGDKVELFFSLGGKKQSDTWHKTYIRAAYIKHADIQGNDTTEIGGKTPQELNRKRDDVFTGALPYSDGDDDELKDLPF